MTAQPNDSGTPREEVFNVYLADLLRDHSLVAKEERRRDDHAPDVRVTLSTGDLVLLGAKWAKQRSALHSQLEERLEEFPNALGVLGVRYPERLRQADDVRDALAAATDIEWWVHGSRGKPRPDQRPHTGLVADLATHLRNLPIELEGVDRVDAAVAEVRYAVNAAAAALTGHARAAQRISALIADADREKDRAAAIRIGCLVLFNALAFQIAWLAPASTSPPCERPGAPAQKACSLPGAISASTSTTSRLQSRRADT